MDLGALARGTVALLFLQSSWSFEGKQAIGFWLLLAALARNRQERASLLSRFRRPSNTNHYLAGFSASALVREFRADPAAAERIEPALESMLAAQGDNLFWRALRPFWGAAAVFAGLLGLRWAPWLFLAGFGVCTLATRIAGLFIGLRSGKSAVRRVADHVPRVGHGVELAGALLIGLLIVPGLFGHERLVWAWSLPAFGLAFVWRAGHRSPSPLFLLYLMLAWLVKAVA